MLETDSRLLAGGRGPARAGRTLVLLLFSLAAPAAAQDEPPFALESALQSAAKTFFATGASAAATLEVTRVRLIDRYADGVSYETYEVKAGSQKAGRFTRMQVFPDASSTIDVAILRDGSAVKGVVPLRPVVMNGRKIPEFTKVLEPLKGRSIGAYARGMAVFFDAVGLLGTAASGPPKAPSVKRGASTTPLVVVSQPELKLGDPMPAFDAAGLDGKPAGSAGFKGRLGAVLVASMRDQMSRDMFQAVWAELAGRPEFRFVTIFSDSRQDAETFRRYLSPGHEELGETAIDADGALAKLFKAPILPYLYLFDKKGKLRAKTFWQGEEKLRADVAKVAKEAGK